MEGDVTNGAAFVWHKCPTEGARIPVGQFACPQDDAAQLQEKMKTDPSQPPFTKIANDLGELVTEKNKAYGDSFRRSGEILNILYPNGVRPHQYEDMLGVVRVIDKLFRIANAKDDGSDQLGESPWRDVGGYGILGTARSERSTR